MGANPVTRVLSDRTGDGGGRPLRKIDMKQIRHANVCFSEMFKHKVSASTFVRLVFSTTLSRASVDTWQVPYISHRRHCGKHIWLDMSIHRYLLVSSEIPI